MSIYLSYGCLITPLGNTVKENYNEMIQNHSGVSKVINSGFNNEDWPLGKISSLTSDNHYQELLSRGCDSLIELKGTDFFKSKDILVILSSTKADIQSLPNDTFESTRRILNTKFQLANKPIIISNACISGVLAINNASDYIKSKKYKSVVVIGIDALSDFVTYGFQSLFALSSEPSAPFDENRKGICIGEAIGSVILSDQKDSENFQVEYLGGSSTNDANHISGPSRTGEGLFRSVNKSFDASGVDSSQIDFVSAHGTGTLFNDEMESIAFDRLDISKVPTNSLKGYFGHTLGAAGIIEVICTMLMMQNGIVFKSIGFEKNGTSKDINIAKSNLQKPINIALKTASGFGGGNASLILKSLQN